MQTSLSATNGCDWSDALAQTFLIDVFQKAAMRAVRPSLKDARRWHYMQILFIILQAAQILPWLGLVAAHSNF